MIHSSSAYALLEARAKVLEYEIRWVNRLMQ